MNAGDTLVDLMLPGGNLLAGRYELLEPLGRGGMGVVHRARDHQLGLDVAVKLLAPDLAAEPAALARLRSEVTLAREVTHRNVVRTFDFGSDGDRHFLTMELVRGQSLGQHLARAGRLPVPESIRIARAIAAGLAAAHDAGVLHRDLKPDNVLLADDSRVLLVDFGVAGARGSAGRTGGVRGTPAYMAPEQVTGRTLDGRADLYALGAVLFEMLTGSRAWPGDDPFEVAFRRLREDPPALTRPDLPPALTALVAALLAREPEQRPVDGREVALRLAAVALPTSTTGSTAADLPRRGAKSVAVLPFQTAGTESWLGEALAEELIDVLSMTAGLRVRPFAVPSSNDAVAIGAELGVDLVITGSIRPRGDSLRLKVRVVGVDEGFQLWAERFVCAPSDVLGTADEVAASVAERLTVDLAPPPRHLHVDPRVVDLYLRGRHALRAGWHSGVSGALAQLEEASTLAPADPHIAAAVAQARMRRAYFGRAPSSDLPDALAACRHAVELGPEIGEAWLALAMVQHLRMDLPAAATAVRRALAVAPGLALGQELLGMLLCEAGRPEEGERRLRAALDVDPSLVGAALGRVHMAALAGEWGAVRERLRPLMESGRSVGPTTHAARYALWTDQIAMPRGPGNFRSKERDTGQLMAFVHLLGELHAGKSGALEQLKAYRNDEPGLTPMVRARIAQMSVEIAVFAGDDDAAVADIQQLGEIGSADVSWIDGCPLLDRLRQRDDWSTLRAPFASRAAAVLAATES